MVIIGVVAVLRFMKTAFATKHAESSIKHFDNKRQEFEREKELAKRKEGQISISKSQRSDNVEDIDFEEMK
jgi:hypothetical protein